MLYYSFNIEYMSKMSKKAFTLVELIVVITILAILWTIAFIAFHGYAKSARDGSRISDLSLIKQTLELYALNKGKYPETTYGVEITYSGSEVWTQWSFGETTFRSVEKMNKIPRDPLTEDEYNYSVTHLRNEYQIAALLEGEAVTMNPVVSEVYAADILAKAYVTGDYNGKVVKVNTGALLYILAVPSLIASDISGVLDIEQLLTAGKLVINGQSNLPSNYEGSTFIVDAGFSFVPNNIVVYSGSTTPTSDAQVIQFIINLQNAYSGTTLENDPGLQDIISLDVSNTELVKQYGGNIVQNDLGGVVTYEIYACVAQPDYPHATFTTGTPTQENTPWQSTNSWNACYYVCDTGYQWEDCNTVTPPGDCIFPFVFGSCSL